MRALIRMGCLAAALWARPAVAAGPCGSCHDDALNLPGHQLLLPKHPKALCTDCHHGDGAATTAEAAHAQMGPDQLLSKARTGAACVRCHLPGSVAGTEAVVAGGRIYLEQGCFLCHQSQAGLGNLAAFAPPLSTIGGRGTPYLHSLLDDPKATFKDTVMPSYRMALGHAPGSEEALLTFLLAQRADLPTPPAPALAGERCGSCHQKGAPARDRLAQHRCRFILDEAASLSCARCHQKGVPRGDRECLYIEQRRNQCGVCHEGAVHGG